MARMPKNWERRLVELAAIHGVTDFLARGRLTKAESKAFYAILNKIGKPAARQTGSTAARLAGTGVRLGKTIALRHPVLTAGAVVYYTYKNRDEIADLVEQGYDIVQPAMDPARQYVGGVGTRAREFVADPVGAFEEALRDQPLGRPITGKLMPGRLPGTRKKSGYNKAVSAGMKAIKQSTSYGKKGTIKPVKKAFTAVVNVGKLIKAKRKKPKNGIRSKVYTAMKRFYK